MFVVSILDKKLRQVNLVTYSDVHALSLGADKNKEKIEKLQAIELTILLCKTFGWW